MQLSVIQILTIINSGISLIMGFYMLLLRKSTTGIGIGFWASGSLVIGFGLLFRLFPPYNAYLSMVAPGLMVSVGLYLYLAGIWKFKQRKIHYPIIIGFPLADFLQSLVFFFVFHSFQLQLAIHVLFLSVYCVIAIVEMLNLSPEQNFLKQIFRINAFSFFIFFLLLMINLAAVMQNRSINPSELSNAGIVLHIISGFVMIALTFGFLTAANMQLSNDLRSQLKSRDRFFSIIAHDLRGPVGNIMSFLELLSNESDFTEQERRNFIGTLNVLSRSTFHLLQNLLEWATKSKNLNKYENEKLELNHIVSNNIDFFKSSAAIKSIHLDFKPGEKTHISGNANMLLTIIRNIISNAIKFTPQGGKITIATRNEDKNVRLTVTDTGQGIKPETINSILNFKENKSTKGTEGEPGSGLGLLLCKEFVEQNEGTIQFESQPGAGTTVTVEFPGSK